VTGDAGANVALHQAYAAFTQEVLSRAMVPSRG
jgi:hypothetical protein